MRYPLSKLKPGQAARIILLFEHKSSPCSADSDSASIRCRLLDLGFEPGTEVVCLLKKHGDELSAFLVKGAVIALRREDADLVLAEEIDAMEENCTEKREAEL